MLLGAIQGVLLSFLLFTKKTNHTANVVLSVAMLALSADVFNAAYIVFGYYKEFAHYTGITYSFPFLFGPIFYLYAKLVSTNDTSFKPEYYLHFIPFLLVVIYGIIFVYLKNSEFKIALIQNELETPPPGLNMIGYMKPIHGIIYVFLTIKVVKTFNNKIRNSFSNIEKLNLNWLKHLTIGLSIVWSIVVLTIIVNEMSGNKIELDYMIYLSASFLIYTIGYLSLRQPQIFDLSVKKTEADTSVISGIKLKEAASGYKKSGLNESEAKTYLEKLLQIMNSEKPYLNGDLTLGDLAKRLSISSHNLSEILNTKLSQNFYDFINQYRVEEVKKRLADKESEKFNLIAVAFDSGFNSKSAFNTIFKKYTGTTPSQYRKEILKNNRII